MQCLAQAVLFHVQGKDVLEWNSIELTRVRGLETVNLDDQKVRGWLARAVGQQLTRDPPVGKEQ